MDSRSNEARIEWNERPIVGVEATVMKWDEIGFTPHLGYGNSRVAIYESVPRTEYLLYGFKIQDKKKTLDSLIPPRMPFTIATPIFHHFVIDNQKMGLSFNGTADARSFDRGIRVVLENLEKSASMNTSSSSSSSEPNSASPTSTQSFTLPSSEDTASPDSQPNTATSSNTMTPLVLSRQTVSKTIPHTFRPQTASSSSSKRRPTTPTRRRHSSSVPGGPYRSLSSCTPPVTPITPTCVTEFSVSPIKTSSPPSTPKSPCKANTDKKKETENPISPTINTEHRHRPTTTSSRRHRSRQSKTPNLDNLERQRDLQPTKPNSYVQIASSRNPSTRSVVGMQLSGRGFRTSEEPLVNYTTRFASARSGIRSSYEYRYHGLKPTDETNMDLYRKTLYNATPQFNSYADHTSILKQPSLNKAMDFSKRGSGKRKEDLGERSRCRYCHFMYNHDTNRPGACADAPTDSCEQCIEYVSCLPVPQCVFYNCFRDSEGNYDQEPCSCSQYNSGSRRRRWIVLALLSLVIPCLCLYPLLKGCHRCGVACHCCGGRHEPSRESPCRPNHRR